MGKPEVESRLVQLFEDIFEFDDAPKNEEICQENIKDWDSIGHVRLISALEKEFNMQIPIETAVEFENFNMIADYLFKNLCNLK
ncbi:acyl carrier protein [Candidatus Pacearchaeota archaeon]|nr:acyl carrier protein [Candidatus Pacearchaeota archaeon]